MVEEAHQTLDDRQLEPQALAAISLRIFQLAEFLKDFPMLVFRNTAPGIPDLDPNRLRRPPRTENDPAAIGVAHRVGEEVAHDPFQQHRITVYEQRVTQDPE